MTEDLAAEIERRVQVEAEHFGPRGIVRLADWLAAGEASHDVYERIDPSIPGHGIGYHCGGSSGARQIACLMAERNHPVPG
jgi:hypothetical protein